MHTVIIGPEVVRNSIFEQFCSGPTTKRHFKIIDNKVVNKIYNGTWELVQKGELFTSKSATLGCPQKSRSGSLGCPLKQTKQNFIE